MPKVPDSPRSLRMPHEFWLPHQQESTQVIVDAEETYTGLTKPTASGKSAVIVGTALTENRTVVVLTRSKQLQAQYEGEFRQLLVSVKGMNNYDCLIDKNVLVNEAMCRSGFRCPEMSRCGYFVQKLKGEQAQIVVTNYDYALASITHDNTIINGRYRLVCDEAHYLDEKITEAYSLEINKSMEPHLGKLDFSDRGISEWRDYCHSLYQKIVPDLAALQEQVNATIMDMNMNSAFISFSGVDPANAALLKKFREFSHIAETLFKGTTIDDSWIIYAGQEKVTFRPLWISGYAQNMFNRVSKVTLMSATLPSKSVIMRLFGIDGDDLLMHETPSNIPVENRLVYLHPMFPMNRANEDEGVQRQASAINKILDSYANEKVLIHCASNRLRDKLVAVIEWRHKSRVMLHETKNRSLMIEKFSNTNNNSVMISPSMESGVDIPSLKVQIISKVLYPDLGDPWVAARLAAWPDWYNWRTVANMCQAIGRVPRNAHTKGVTYILDSKFETLAQRGAQHFPQYIKDAVYYKKQLLFKP